MDKLSFSKMQSLGNDFVVLDGLTHKLTTETHEIRDWSDRNLGIGFDQLLVIEPPSDPRADFFFRIFNADGSEAEQCGNGTRCAALFVLEKSLTKKTQLKWQSLGGEFQTSYSSRHEIETLLTVPNHEPTARSLKLNGIEHEIQIYGISIGNPHAVTFVDDIQNIDVEKLGRAIAADDSFPAGANVGFCQVIDSGFLRLRVCERGAGETMACGTGACAAVVVSASKNLIKERVKVSLPGGKLKVFWPAENSTISLKGPATTVFNGSMEI